MELGAGGPSRSPAPYEIEKLLGCLSIKQRHPFSSGFLRVSSRYFTSH
jgi:hypothetical protein